MQHTAHNTVRMMSKKATWAMPSKLTCLSPGSMPQFLYLLSTVGRVDSR